jgi:glutamyl-tRNA synthetase
MADIRTRFAPSPTGYIHIGGIRTALFAWLVARQNNGKFILRFEDTDQKREVEGAKAHVIKSLDSLGLNYDEGPGKNGPFGPYVQSERLEIYKNWAAKLIQSGRAYADPYSSKQVQEFRDAAQINMRPFLYREHRPEETLNWDGSTPLRFKSDPKAYTWHDAVMGKRTSGPESIDDFILIKSDGFPTYNFAHIIDDYEMQISHVLRGQEFLASVPNYLNLYEALSIEPPILATLPPVLAPDGKKKLSKRDGAKDVLEYISQGYLADGLVSFIATLGWNDGSQQEIFSRQELIDKFDLSKVQKSGANLDDKRLNWIDGSLIRQMPIEDLYEAALPYWPQEAEGFADNYKKQVLGLLQERLKYLAEINDLSRFFFKDLPIDQSLISSNKQLSKFTPDEIKQMLDQSLEALTGSDFSLIDLNERLNGLLETTGQKPAVMFSLIRIATTQSVSSPGLANSLAVLGKETSLKRINEQLAALR